MTENKPKKRTRKTRRSALKIGQIEAALRVTGGFVTYAAKKLGVTHQAVTSRIKASERLQRVQDEIRESYLDLSEHKLITKIKDEDLGAIIFFLKCRGKGRGYIEKQQIENVTEQQAQPIKVVIEVEDASKS